MSGTLATEAEIRSVEAEADADDRDELLARIAGLQAQLDLMREQWLANEWKHMTDRFHAFDGIKNDRCPACGSAVRVEENHNSVRLVPR